MAQLARRQPAERGQVLEGGQLDLVLARLARPRGALVLTGELDAAEQIAQPGDAVGQLACPRSGAVLRFWLCTHWPSCSRMARVSPEERFAANLRRLRTAAGLSQEQLAGRTGLHPTEISRLERAVREPRLGTIVRLARGLGVGIEGLVAGIR